MIFRLALTLFTIKICLHFLTLFSKILVMRLEFRLVPVLIERYLSAFERMPFFSFSSRSLGDYLSRFHDMTEAGNLFNSIFNGFLMNLIVFIMSLGALFWVRPMIAFYILASSALLIVLYRAFMPGLRAVRYSFDLESNRLNTRFSDLIGSFELLSSKSLKDFFRHSILKDQVGRQVRINRELRQRTMLFDLVLDFFTLSYSFEVILIVMFLFGRFESVSESITISFYFASILGPMIHLLSTFSEFMEFRLKARRIDNILALNPARYEFCEQDDTRTPLVRIIEAGLGVGGKVLFHSVNLDIYSGAKIALMGRSGIGKTSLLRILTGMVHHTSGRVVFSKALSEGDRVSIVLYVPQHTQLTRGTLREFFSPEIEGFGADFFVKFKRLFGPELRSGSTEELLDLQVSPSGGMSRGQIQRAVILKSLFDPSPLKLYDEPTANLDPESTQSVLELVFRDSAAVVLVSHDQRVYLKGVTRFEVTSDGLFPRA
jgi:ABC-type bacteriocin/lantibiotic exporter with double-glycine peptidase domain